MCVHSLQGATTITTPTWDKARVLEVPDVLKESFLEQEPFLRLPDICFTRCLFACLLGHPFSCDFPTKFEYVCPVIRTNDAVSIVNSPDTYPSSQSSSYGTIKHEAKWLFLLIPVRWTLTWPLHPFCSYYGRCGPRSFLAHLMSIWDGTCGSLRIRTRIHE